MTDTRKEEAADDIAELRALAMRATNVNWRPGHLCRDDHSCDCRYIFADNDSMGAVASVHVDDGKNDCPKLDEAKANQAFIAAANPPRIIEMADLITTLRQQVEEAREALAQCEGALKAGGFEEGFAADACRKWRERYPA